MIRLAKKSLVVAALMASTSAIASSGWSVSEASGSVTITRGDNVIQARKNSRLNEGDVIRTGKGARAVLVRGKEYVVVSPKAHIRIAEPEKAGPVTQIFQYLGNVLFKIEKKSTPHFGVETPFMAAVVKGTTFNVSVGEDGTSVQVTEGAVEVTTGDDLEAALLTPGLVGLVEADAIGDLIVISNDPDGPDSKDATVRGNPSFVPALNQPASKTATPIASASSNSDRTTGVNRRQPLAAPRSPQTGQGRANGAASGLKIAIGAPSGGPSDANVTANNDLTDSRNEGASSTVQDFVISEPEVDQSEITETVTQVDSSDAAPIAKSTDSGAVDIGAADGQDDQDAGGSGLVFAEDQPNGSCAGVPNCSGGANPNKSSNGGVSPPSDDANEPDDDVGLNAGIGGPTNDSSDDEVDIAAGLGLGTNNSGNGNFRGNNGNANGIGNGKGGGNGKGNNGNGNGNGGPTGDGADNGVGIDFGVDLGGEGGTDVDLGVDLNLDLAAADEDEDDDFGERGERGEGGEHGKRRGRGLGRGKNN